MWKLSIVLRIPLAFFLLFTFPGRAFGSISLSVSPPFFELELLPGINRAVSIEVTNTGDREVTVRCFLADLSLSPRGDVVLLPEGSTPFSLSSCATLPDKETSFVLGPKATKVVPVRLRLPRGERGGWYGAVVFEALPQLSGGFMLGVRTGTLFLLAPATPERRKVALHIGEREGRISVVLQNEGKTHVRVLGELIVRSREGKILQRVLFPKGDPFLLLPQGVREYILNEQVPEECKIEVRVFEKSKRGLRPLAASEITLPSGAVGPSSY